MDVFDDTGDCVGLHPQGQCRLPFLEQRGGIASLLHCQILFDVTLEKVGNSSLKLESCNVNHREYYYIQREMNTCVLLSLHFSYLNIQSLVIIIYHKITLNRIILFSLPKYVFMNHIKNILSHLTKCTFAYIVAPPPSYKATHSAKVQWSYKRDGLS